VAIIFACDAFGLGLINNKIIAGRFADALGCTVYVPDLLEGDYPALDVHIIDQPISHKSWVHQAIQFLTVIWTMLYKIGPRWIIRHSRGKLQPLTEDFAKALKEEKQLTKIGTIGYCMGGMLSCILAGTDLVDVAVVAHPAPLNKEDFEKVRVPISFICAEEDMVFRESVKKMAQDIITNKPNLPSEFKTYPGTTHGFAARPNMGIPEVKEAFQGAIDQAVNWFTLHLLNA